MALRISFTVLWDRKIPHGVLRIVSRDFDISLRKDIHPAFQKRFCKYIGIIFLLSFVILYTRSILNLLVIFIKDLIRVKANRFGFIAYFASIRISKN